LEIATGMIFLKTRCSAENKNIQTRQFDLQGSKNDPSRPLPSLGLEPPRLPGG